MLAVLAVAPPCGGHHGRPPDLVVPKCPEAQAGLLRTAAPAAACSARSGVAVAKSRCPSRLRTRLSRHPPPTRQGVAVLIHRSTGWPGRGHAPLRRVDWEGTPYRGHVVVQVDARRPCRRVLDDV